MIEHSEILNNPVVDEGVYRAKVVKIETERSGYEVDGYELPKLLVKLELHYIYGIPGSFTAILYPSHQSIVHFRNFFNTFMWGEEPDNINAAIGQEGSIHISPAKYNDKEYSVIRFIPNPAPEGQSLFH